jgi:hypothetical protein
MSTEVETTASSNTETSGVLPLHLVTAPAGPPLWLRRRYQLAAVAALIAIIAGVVTNNFLARQYSADGAVRQYLTALQAGDAASAWNEIQVSAPTTPVAANLSDRAALQAALGAGRPDIKSFAIIGTTSHDPSTAIVDFSYDTSSGTKQGKFVVQRSGDSHIGFYPAWHLVIAPTLLSLSLPKGNAGGVTVDGRAIALPYGKSVVAVLPVRHKLQFDGTQILAAQSVSLDGFLSAGQPVVFQPQVTAAGAAKAKAAVNAAFATCAQSTSPNPDNSGTCPQTIGVQLPISGQWQVIGDPTQDLTIKFDGDLNTTGVGHYQMAFVWQDSHYQSAQHLPASGAYSAVMQLAAADVSVTSIQYASNVPPMQRPAGATDQAAKDIVAKAMTQCAAVRSQFVADCPQRLLEAGPTNVSWSMTGDPLAGATVVFDSNSGLFTVHGNFNMAASYTWFGYPKSVSSFDSAYDAYLFWDGQALQLVTIDGSNS